MIVKTVFKSHFKIKKKFLKNNSKRIFVKNIFIFLLFSKIFLKNCLVSFFFRKDNLNKINLLKAPSRHKKFFHQIFYEYFQVKFIFKFNKIFKKINNTVEIFTKFNKIFKKIGSNTLNRVKFSISFCCLILYLI
jgi:hypothetical protein